MTGSAKFLGMRARENCPVRSCDGKRTPSHFCCKSCWGRLPAHVRRRILEEFGNCRKAGIPHSQELHRLRDEAIALLNREADARARRPQPAQLNLPDASTA